MPLVKSSASDPSWQKTVISPPDNFFFTELHVLTLQKDKNKELQVNGSENLYLYSAMAQQVFPDPDNSKVQGQESRVSG